MSADVEAQLAQVDALRRRVVNVVGHALRTPVTTLRGLVDVLDASDDPATRERVVPSLVRTTRTLERLLDDLLLISGVTTVLPVRSPERIELADIVTAVWRELGDPDELEVTGTATAYAPEDATRWIVWHLLDNAAAYGGRPVTVTFDRVGTDRVVCTVETPGDAWPSADLELLFELFYRGEDAVMRRAGMGIGLPVARTLSEHAGGTLALLPREGGGLAARLELPAP